MTVSDLSESELVARIQSRLPPPPAWLIVGIGDDAAVVEPAPNRLEVLSVDALVEGVHFDRRFTPPEAVGHRALAVNLSDLAAMGAEPRLALLSLALPSNLACAEFDAMIGGLTRLASRYRLYVVGGNLTRSPGPIVIDVTVSGTVKRRQALVRSGAKPGDFVYVTGSIGAAAAELQMLQQGSSTHGARYLYPEPRVRTGMLLARNRAASACMDLSDGLADGVRRIAASSGVGMVVEAETVPIDAHARRWYEDQGADPVDRAMTGGDDYELLFTTRPRWAGRLRSALAKSEVVVAKIGVCTEGADVVLRRGSTESAISHGYKHFA